MPHITPDSVPGLKTGYICYPDDEAWRAAISGQLSELTYEKAWQQVGGIAPDVAAEAAQGILWSWLDETCQPEQAASMASFWSQHAREDSNNPGSIATTGTLIEMFMDVKVTDNDYYTVVSDTLLLLAPGKYLVNCWHHFWNTGRCLWEFNKSIPDLEIVTRYSMGAYANTVATSAFQIVGQMVCVTSSDFDTYLSVIATRQTGVANNTDQGSPLQELDHVYGGITIARLGDV